jgi:hypothetical protein
MSDKSRRKLLKSIAAGSGAIVAGKSLPESWSRPVVDSVMLPAHAQTSLLQYSEEILDVDPCDGATSGTAQTTSIDFDVTGITPASSGTLIATISGDIGDPTETYTVSIEGTSLGQVGPGPSDGSTISETFTIDLSVLQAAAVDGTITITFTPDATGGENPINCGPPNTVGAELSFSYSA